MSDSKADQKKMRRVDLDVNITQEEFDQISFVLKKKAIANTASQTTAFPKETEQGVISAFYKAAFDSFAESQVLEQKWWEEVSDRYKFKDKVYFDIDSKKFYTLEEMSE